MIQTSTEQGPAMTNGIVGRSANGDIAQSNFAGFALIRFASELKVAAHWPKLIDDAIETCWGFLHFRWGHQHMVFSIMKQNRLCANG